MLCCGFYETDNQFSLVTKVPRPTVVWKSPSLSFNHYNVNATMTQEKGVVFEEVFSLPSKEKTLEEDRKTSRKNKGKGWRRVRKEQSLKEETGIGDLPMQKLRSKVS